MGCQCRLKEGWQQQRANDDQHPTTTMMMDIEEQNQEEHLTEEGDNSRNNEDTTENIVIIDNNNGDNDLVISGFQSSVSSPMVDVEAVDFVVDKTQRPSSSGCSAKSSSAESLSKKDEKKRLIQRRLTELKNFLPLQPHENHNSNQQRNKYKSATLDTLNQLLDLLKNRNIHHDNENCFGLGGGAAKTTSAFYSTCKNFTELLNDAQPEDKDLTNHKSAVTFELSENGIIMDIRWNILHNVLSWLESSREQFVGKNFSDFIYSGSSCSLAFLQIVSSKNNETKCGYIKLTNSSNACVDSVTVPCKIFTFWNMPEEHTRKLMVTVLPLAATWIYEPRTLSTTFYTKHSHDCRFIDVDNKVISSLGYLPQELLGRSFLSFITEESCDVFRSSHEQAVKANGKPVRSNAYQFVIRNGNQVTLQTEWCLFVNPWTKFVEFVMGCHTVVEGSQRRDVFANHIRNNNNNNDRPIMQMSEKASNVQASVAQLLSQPLAQKHSSSSSQRSLSSRKNGKSCRSGSTYKTYSKSDVKTEEGAKEVNGKLTRKDMSTLFDRMVEHEYFMADAASVQEDFWKKGSPRGSFPASGDGSSRSPPESSGSGPSYNEIRGLANVDRLLKSQEGQSSDESTGHVKNHPLKSSSCSPANGETEGIVVDVLSKQQQSQHIHSDAPQVLNNAILEALYNTNNGGVQVNHMQISSMHRSHSAAADLDHCRTAVKLTSEILHTFTKEQERQHKTNWKQQQHQQQHQQQQQQLQQAQQHKRRFSVELQQVALKRALEPSMDSNACGGNLQKISRPEVYRPASMPVIVRQTEPSYFLNPLMATTPNNIWNNPPGKSNTNVNYYRSLGPTPAPPPGKNFQITSAPLPVAPIIDERPLSPLPLDRQSAFVPLKKPPVNENWNSTSLGGASSQQPINLSLRPEAAAAGPPSMGPSYQTSVIQSGTESPEAGRLTWLNAPGASASIALQRMTQSCRTMIRDPQWPTGATARLIPSTNDDPLYRYQCNSQDMMMPPTDINGRLLSTSHSQRSVINAQNFNENNAYYSMPNFSSNTDVSPIREATESLMLLEDL